MKFVVFAGGTGRRLWPISRQSSPKQFEPIIRGKSTVQLALQRLLEGFGIDDIFVSTNQSYIDILKKQLPYLPRRNFIGEPVRRDLAAAVGLSVVHLDQIYDRSERFAIVWGDNYMTNTGVFLDMLGAADKIIASDKAKIVFIGETPRFANNNLGWIGVDGELGKQDKQSYFAFSSWDYRPPIDRCQEMYASGNYVWNTGYFVSSLGFIIESYQKFQPEMWASLNVIAGSINQSTYEKVLAEVYPTIEVASFDDAIVKYIANDQAVVLHGDTGWSDPGTLYALKESINPDKQANVKRGLVRANRTKDSLLYNYEEGKLLAAVGLDGMIVVNTEDALLVVHKDQIALVKELVNELVGSELEKYS